MKCVEFILYVADQNSSTEFYKHVLQVEPSLHVDGMTEFTLSENCKLGLMPEKGIAQIITPVTPNPETGNGIPRCELYLKVETPESYLERALEAGAVLVSEIQPRNWGDKVGYVMDADGHILAFAQ